MPAALKEKILVKEVKKSEGFEEQALDNQGRAYATGKRKNAIARVWIKKGTGKIKVNDRDAKTYFGREILLSIVNSPFAATKNASKFDVVASIAGGGLSGQAGALTHGISKALAAFEAANHALLKARGFLTRDSRIVERKKYGLKKARKGQTYRKR